MEIAAIDQRYRDAVNQILKEEWGCPPSVSLGRAIDTRELPGFVSLSDGGAINGVVTYHIRPEECEIVTLNSLDENKGIGTALIHAVIAAARAAGCHRLWLITTNDDIDAIRFYQLKGFDWVAWHRDTMDAARKLKPQIPMAGMYGIPIRHELEFEMKL